MNFLTESACAIREMFLIKRPFFPRCRFRKCPTMAKPTKKKSSSKRPSASKARPARKAPVKRPVLKKVSRTAKTAKGGPSKSRKETTESPALLLGMNHREKRLDPFVRQQKEKLLQLRDAMVDSMAGVAQDTLRSRAEGSEASAFGMHQADAGSDAYDRDFALSLLSREQDALYEITQALRRIELGTYGICEMSGNPIPCARLEAIPFARFTVECQSQLERQTKVLRLPPRIISPFASLDTE